MNSWLYLTAKGFAHSVEIDYDNAPVFVWHDAQSPTETSLSEAAAGLKGRRRTGPAHGNVQLGADRTLAGQA